MTPPTPQRIAWYRSPVGREELKALNQRSDWKGFLQTGGYLSLLAATGTAAYFSVGRLPWPVVVMLFFLHGTCYGFTINGFHELVHDSVFKTKRLNRFFLCILSFMGWHNHVFFWASHMAHHKYTLHPPDDLEVVLPLKHLTLRNFLSSAIIHPVRLHESIWGAIRLSLGRLEGEWEHHLFPESDTESRRRLFNWARIVLFGHIMIIVVSCIFQLWWLPVVTTFAPFYGYWMHFLCNYSQHAGLQSNVSDLRLCTRTMYLNPFLQFLYWNMNYHIEHHMYAAVPCYHLPKLHRLIKDDLPHCPNGLIETWTEIVTIRKRQHADPDYQYIPELPT